MKFEDYQQAAKETAIYPEDYEVTYPVLGLAGEVGEFANKWKKVLRDDAPVDRHQLGAELGDILWYVSAIASDLGLHLDEIARNNVHKLMDRKQRGVIGGSGDER